MLRSPEYIDNIDRRGHDELYAEHPSDLACAQTLDQFVQMFEKRRISPFFQGGTTKGYVRGEAVRRLLQAVSARLNQRQRLVVLDAGCGLGELSVYLASMDFDVVGIDVSSVACTMARQLASKFGVSDHCRFLAESLETISVPAQSIDFVIGHAALHHFIKYDGVPGELYRVMKPGACAFFADSFGENQAYHVFHDRKTMDRLGDVILTRTRILEHFKSFDVRLIPMDWFTMLDKLYERISPERWARGIRALSRVHFCLDRMMPRHAGWSLFLAGSVLTIVQKNHNR